MTGQPAEPPKPPKASVLVVSHNRVDQLRRCLESLERSRACDESPPPGSASERRPAGWGAGVDVKRSGPGGREPGAATARGPEDRQWLDILVVDNGSTDGSPQLEADFPAVRFIPLPRNFGLTKALNIGIRASSGEFVLLLHEDTEVSADALGQLAAVLEARSDAAAVSPLLVDESGAPAPQLGSFPPGGRWTPAEAGSDPVPVGYARGAALMVRGFFLKAMRQIDERYGQFGSDAEICWQIRRGAKKILLVPAARVIHRPLASPAPSALLAADAAHGRAAWIGKYQGFAAGVRSRLGAILKALAGGRLGEFKHLVSMEKIDGA
ncbi:MAG: glycosyltransferase [Acidobacteria bacterium]|nr:glycosyltransferase [Acidobacteriota bacterium]